MVVHHLRRLRRAVPRRHRARRRHRRHAPLPERSSSRPSRPSSAACSRTSRSNGNPWGMAPGPRLDWAKDLPFDGQGASARTSSRPDRRRLPVLGRLRRRLRGPRQEDDPRGGRAARHRRGRRSRCSATARPAPATRPAAPATSSSSRCSPQQNVETLNEVGATKIVVTCAHCFNTIKNEYPQLGGKYEVRAPHPAAQPAGPREEARARSRARATCRHVVDQGRRLDRAPR